jgi:transcriptional regulator of aromatic amino acid metabolism
VYQHGESGCCFLHIQSIVVQCGTDAPDLDTHDHSPQGRRNVIDASVSGPQNVMRDVAPVLMGTSEAIRRLRHAVAVAGGHSTTCVDVRLIAATNRDLAKSVVAKEFRLDLFYRLTVLHLQTTAFHERREDIPVLLAHFMDECSRSCSTAGQVTSVNGEMWPSE